MEGEYESVVRTPWNELPLPEKIELLREQCERLKTDERIVDWSAALWHGEEETLLLSSDGSRVQQAIRTLLPTLSK